ncbi:hypothetical protein NX773_00975 [Massilia solisilvae]|uniref:EfeO-type cupredoxin-like domain-containing protein n=1 Tax=Massilia solisilvae TaxID=1811225 RepID=A0ABT2BF75_9BURK|nr:hypothetical protein [Massilia solisilvae]MCS0606735.1 hypothetical protein [Massilia solisilvae]
MSSDSPTVNQRRRPGQDMLRRRRPQLAAGAAMVALLLWGAFAPLAGNSRELPVEIPAGTDARRLQGEPVELLPQLVTLTLGVQDVLLLRNRDKVPQVFGPVLVMPGQEFRLPFEQAGDYQFNCSAHASGQMTVRVVGQPDPGWDRLRWRARKLVHELRYLPLVGPRSG